MPRPETDQITHAPPERWEWEEYCDKLESALTRILKDDPPAGLHGEALYWWAVEIAEEALTEPVRHRAAPLTGTQIKEALK